MIPSDEFEAIPGARADKLCHAQHTNAAIRTLISFVNQKWTGKLTDINQLKIDLKNKNTPTRIIASFAQEFDHFYLDPVKQLLRLHRSDADNPIVIPNFLVLK